MVDYEQSFKKPFTDLVKLLIGIILSAIPIVNWIAQGFIIECSGVGKNKPSKNMPEWKDIWNYFVKGLLSYIIAIIYALPAIIVFGIVIGYAAGSLMTTFMGVMPQGFTSSFITGQANGQLSQTLSQNWMLALPTIISMAPLILLGLLLLLIASYLSPMAILNYLKNKKFSKAFDFNFVTSKAFKVNYFIIWLVAGVITSVLNAILSFIPFVGSAIAFFISGVIAFSLFGQYFREK